MRTYLRCDKLELVETAVTEVMGAKFKSLQDETTRLSAENTELKARVTTLEPSIEEAEQYSRCKIPEKEGKATDKIILSVVWGLYADFSPSDIDRSHRVGKPKRDKYYENTLIQIYRTFHLEKKMKIFRRKLRFFSYFCTIIDCGYSLEPPHRGVSNEYPQSKFLSRNKKILYTPVNPSFTI